MQAQLIDIKRLKANTGQIDGLPTNPRLIKDHRFAKLLTSIKDDPEMMELRECLVFPFGSDYVVIGGNMRLMALKELNYSEVPCKVLDADTPPEKLRAYTIKDNLDYGSNDWDLLANEWSDVKLKDWGVELPIWDSDEKDYSDKNKEIDIDGLSELMDLKFKFSKDDYFDTQNRINDACSILGVDNKEDGLRALLTFFENDEA